MLRCRDNDGMSLILSHSTALLYHRVVASRIALDRYPLEPSPLRSGVPAWQEIERARELLHALGAPMNEVETLDVLVSTPEERRHIAGVRMHVSSLNLPVGSLIRIEPGMYVADARLCLLQLARSLQRLELVELCYELCGAYAMPVAPEDSYRDRAPLVSTRELESFLRAASRVPGATKALWATRYTCDGARSPMESASVMTLVLPKATGGLGIRGLTMDHPIPVVGAAQRMTRRQRFYADAYIESARLLIEYMGMYHEDELQQVRDNERENALGAMGYRVVNIWRGALFDRDNYRRVLARICECTKQRATRFPDGFEELQEALRQFVIRRWV